MTENSPLAPQAVPRTMPNSPKKSRPWVLPGQVMQLQKLRKKKKALQARILSSPTSNKTAANTSRAVHNEDSNKRRNPFQIAPDASKKPRSDSFEYEDGDESSDRTLFKLIHLSSSNNKTEQEKQKENLTSFCNVLASTSAEQIEPVKAEGESWIPVDWTLKTKMKLLSRKPFPFNHKLKMSEEASGLTSFVRSLDVSDSPDASIKAQFHQCCLYWQQPVLPWLELYPRKARTKTKSDSTMISSVQTVREGLRVAYTDSLRSLFQLLRTKQCPYFYLCANHYTVLFRAAGIGGFSEIHALITPSTRGLRQMLKQKDIEYSMPFRSRQSDQNVVEEEGHREDSDEEWLESMGIDQKDIKQINYTQDRINYNSECALDNDEQSLLLIEGVEVQGLYNFLLNCKSAIPTTGQHAGIPPTLLSSVAFQGATLNALKVRESKAHLDNEDYYSLELCGPILPQTVHNICDILPKEQSFSATFATQASTGPFSKLCCAHSATKQPDGAPEGSAVFRQENLSDCGLKLATLKRFCSEDAQRVANVEGLKYGADTETFSWT